MANSRKDKVNAAYGLLTGGDKKPAKEKINPVGVKLTAAELGQLDTIAKELGVSRHELLQYAARELIARYDRGDKPKTGQRIITTLKPE